MPGCPLSATDGTVRGSPQAPAALQQKAWHLAHLRLPEPSFSSFIHLLKSPAGLQSHVQGRGPSRTVLWSGEARSARPGAQGLTSRQCALSQTPLCPG